MVPGPRESTTKTESSGAKDVLLHRLVRSMSGRDIVNGNVVTSSGDTSTNHEGSEDIPSLTRTQSATSLSSQASQKLRLSVADRLKRLSLDLPLRLRRNGKSEPASPRVTLVEAEDVDTSARDTAITHGKMLSMVDERVEDTLLGTDSSTPNNSLSPTTLAQRLRDLIDPLPFPSFSYPVNPPKLPPRDKKGRPIPPKSSPIKDSRLIELLSSATFMNGSQSGGKPRPSVWEILEGLGVPPHGFPEAQSSEPDDGGGGGESDEPVDNQPDYAGTSSVMLYSPLIPGKDDIVELAELVPFSVEERVIYDAAASKSWTSMWPLSLLPTWPQSSMQILPVIEAPLSGDFSGNFIHSDVTSIDVSGRKLRVTTTSAWVPSTTKMSFQAMWWGYRLWLPPPVMAVLSDRSLEAAKRATLIATALAWFFNNLPVNLFPPPVRPALLLLQRIVPYLGYIATFISWSWGAIKGYDLGHGVTLTATWLLPFALIPGTWFESEVPKSPSQSPPTTVPTLPPKTSPSTPSQPPVDIPDGPTTPPTTTPPMTGPPMTTPPITSPPISPPTTSPPNQPSQPGESPSQPSPQPTPGGPSPLPQQPTTPTPGTDDQIISPPTVSVPSLSESLLVSSPRSFAKKLFALSHPKISGPPLLSPPLTPVPMPRTPVQAGSVLGEELLHAPALRSIPLPNESSDAINVMHKRRKEKKTSPLFHRIRK